MDERAWCARGNRGGGTRAPVANAVPTLIRTGPRGALPWRGRRSRSAEGEAAKVNCSGARAVVRKYRLRLPERNPP